jgi:hypothetical protein
MLRTLIADIEQDYWWRKDEIRFFEHYLRLTVSARERDVFRKALVLLLYSHLEGFCKFTLSVYVRGVNTAALQVGDVCSQIAAAGMSGLLSSLCDPQRKSDFFRRKLPDDTTLHRFARQAEFASRLAEFSSQPVCVPEEIVDMESNITPFVLRKNLFRLGLFHRKFESREGTLHRLLSMRNSIAHGARRHGIDKKEYKELKSETDGLMKGIRQEIVRALINEEYRS